METQLLKLFKIQIIQISTSFTSSKFLFFQCMACFQRSASNWSKLLVKPHAGKEVEQKTCTHKYMRVCFSSPACACADNRYHASLIRLCARLYVQRAAAAGGGRENASPHQFGSTGAQTAREQAAAASEGSRAGSKDGAVNALKGQRKLSGSNAEAQPGESRLRISLHQRANCAVFCSTGRDNHIGPLLPVRCRGTSPRKRGMDSVPKEIGAVTKPEKYVLVEAWL